MWSIVCWVVFTYHPHPTFAELVRKKAIHWSSFLSCLKTKPPTDAPTEDLSELGSHWAAPQVLPLPLTFVWFGVEKDKLWCSLFMLFQSTELESTELGPEVDLIFSPHMTYHSRFSLHSLIPSLNRDIKQTPVSTIITSSKLEGILSHFPKVHSNRSTRRRQQISTERTSA